MLQFSATTTTTTTTTTATTLLALLLLLLWSTVTATTVSTCRAATANYITHRLPQQCLRSGSGSGSGSSGGNYTATPISGFEQVAASIAVVTAGVGGEAEGGTQTAIEASRPTQAPSASSTISSENAPTDTAIPPPPPPPPPGATGDEGEDSPLDTAKFLSFEEWKAQNLARAGQSSESFEDRVREPRRGGASGSLNNALDSLGEDAEIEFDFGGEADGGVPEYGVGRSDGPNSATAGGGGGEDSPDPRGHTRSKNAGTTCKERFNYASFDCAATVHKTNPEAKGATSILVENKDSYMLNKCGAEKKFFIVELCDDILVDTVVLANFEFFSSMFRSFKVFVSDRYPIKLNGWKDLGTFEARNSRQVQAFLIENPLIWARYLKVEFLTQYGNEFYCPVSLLRVHGTTMMEEFKHQGEVSAGGAEEDIIEEVVPEAVAVNIEEEVLARATVAPAAAAAAAAAEEAPKKEVYEVNGAPVRKKVRIQRVHGGSAICRPASVLEFAPLFLPTCAVMHMPSVTHSTPTSVIAESSTIVSVGTASSPAAEMGTVSPTSAVPDPPENSVSKEPAPATPSRAKEKEKEPTPNTCTTSAKAPDTTSREPEHHHPPSPPSPPPAPPGTPVTHSHSHPPSAVPTTQESFFKTVHKRLSLLEANATLSLQYIEEQSRILRDAFVKVEKRQMEKTTQFIEKLNSTVLAELRSYREQYDQLWQSTVIALESQNTHTDQQIQTLTTRLTLLTDELLFQRRIYQLQSLLLLLIIITVVVSVAILFSSRGSSSSNSALPGGAGARRLLTRHLHSISQDDDPQTPPPPTPTPRLSPSGDSLTSPTLKFSPPSPTTAGEEEEGEEEEIEGTRSSPATPRGTRDVTARGSAWARFGPRLKTDKDDGGTGGAGRWGRLPSPLGNCPAGGGYTSGSGSEREC
ncbi:UNC-like C-terminal-domain-containing protein [Tuber brumale]|nr:UNC-like C-terminal-domain-containing protein [Tuber brumale]